MLSNPTPVLRRKDRRRGDRAAPSKTRSWLTASSVLYMSVSLDGYIAGPNDRVGNPGGDGGAVERLHAWTYTQVGKCDRPRGSRRSSMR
ncbi:hypothetical protein GCM10028833_31190 [Glycomyces tarimensis]